jgi:heat shock protein HslJ
MKRSTKGMGKLITGMVALALLVLSLPGLSVAQETVECESDYVVQSGDWLAKIADQHYGDDSLYPAIVLATNARSASDSSYATIADPWRIEPGWKLCLPSVQRAQSGFTVQALKNAEYLSEWTASGQAVLTDGEYRESIVPGSATKIVVILSDRMAFGYTSDGKPLAAVILITDPGGSGTFYSLAAVFEQDGKPVNIATTLLGDRVKINSLAAKGDEMVVDMITQGPDDPFCCPTQRVVQTYALQGDQWVQTSSKVLGGAGTGTAIPLEGTLWKLDGYLNSQGEWVSVLPGTEVTAKFDAGQVGGSAGCNGYFGPYERSGNSLTFGVIGVTEMYCAPEALMTQESEYLAALDSAASYQIADRRLEIANADGETALTFSVLEPAPLTGTTWQLNGYNDGQGGFVSVLSGTEITAVFDDGQVAGSAGCNDYTALYAVEGNAITFGPAATTRKMCSEPEGIMEQESAYLAALESVTTFQIEGDELTLMNADGVRVATFTVFDPQAAAASGVVGTVWRWVSTQTPTAKIT